MISWFNVRCRLFPRHLLFAWQRWAWRKHRPRLLSRLPCHRRLRLPPQLPHVCSWTASLAAPPRSSATNRRSPGGSASFAASSSCSRRTRTCTSRRWWWPGWRGTRGRRARRWARRGGWTLSGLRLLFWLLTSPPMSSNHHFHKLKKYHNRFQPRKMVTKILNRYDEGNAYTNVTFP